MMALRIDGNHRYSCPNWLRSRGACRPRKLDRHAHRRGVSCAQISARCLVSPCGSHHIRTSLHPRSICIGETGFLGPETNRPKSPSRQKRSPRRPKGSRKSPPIASVLAVSGKSASSKDCVVGPAGLEPPSRPLSIRRLWRGLHTDARVNRRNLRKNPARTRAPKFWVVRSRAEGFGPGDVLDEVNRAGPASGLASRKGQKALVFQLDDGRCPGPPEPAVTSRGRRTPLPAPPTTIVKY